MIPLTVHSLHFTSIASHTHTFIHMNHSKHENIRHSSHSYDWRPNSSQSSLLCSSYFIHTTLVHLIHIQFWTSEKERERENIYINIYTFIFNTIWPRETTAKKTRERKEEKETYVYIM